MRCVFFILFLLSFIAPTYAWADLISGPAVEECPEGSLCSSPAAPADDPSDDCATVFSKITMTGRIPEKMTIQIKIPVELDIANMWHQIPPPNTQSCVKLAPDNNGNQFWRCSFTMPRGQLLPNPTSLTYWINNNGSEPPSEKLCTVNFAQAYSEGLNGFACAEHFELKASRVNKGIEECTRNTGCLKLEVDTKEYSAKSMALTIEGWPDECKETIVSAKVKWACVHNSLDANRRGGENGDFRDRAVLEFFTLADNQFGRCTLDLNNLTAGFAPIQPPPAPPPDPFAGLGVSGEWRPEVQVSSSNPASTPTFTTSKQTKQHREDFASGFMDEGGSCSLASYVGKGHSMLVYLGIALATLIGYRRQKHANRRG